MAVPESQVEDWQEVLTERAAEALRNGRKLAPVFRSIHEEFGLDEKKISNVYYRKVRPKLVGEVDLLKEGQVVANDKGSKDDSKDGATDEANDVGVIRLYNQEQSLADSLNSPILRPVTPPYKRGQIVKAKVIEFRDYGVKVEIQDEYKYEALIHKSKVSREYVEDLRDYFSLDDEPFEARVLEVKKYGKIDLSTIGMKLPKKPDNDKAVPSTSMSHYTAQLERFKDDLMAKHQERYGKYSDVITYMNKLVGAVSPKAQLLIDQLVQEHGLFKFSKALFEAEQDFVPDLGVLLLREVERKIGGCL